MRLRVSGRSKVSVTPGPEEGTTAWPLLSPKALTSLAKVYLNVKKTWFIAPSPR